MRRRQFLFVLSSAAAWPLSVHAEREMPVIGYLSSGSREGFTTRLSAYERGLQEAGYRERQNVAVEYRWADGRDERLPPWLPNWCSAE
jgi:putative ABC transport system substrate-binding protein